MTTRNVVTTVTGAPAIDGAGVHLIRVLGHDTVEAFDPFLMLDAFDSTNPDDYIKGFPLHPHRGIETFTYLVDGEIDHEDNLGNSGRICGGDCQWMSAGSGILHQEMPQENERLNGLQLWINMPSHKKMSTPQYRDILAAGVPVVQDGGASVRVVAGSYADADGFPSTEPVNLRALDISIDPNGSFEMETEEKATVFAYVLEGKGIFGDAATTVANKTAALFDHGETLKVTASAEGVRFILFEGHPLKEPVAWGGPVVMNTQEELEEAFRELEAGTFIK